MIYTLIFLAMWNRLMRLQNAVLASAMPAQNVSLAQLEMPETKIPMLLAERLQVHDSSDEENDDAPY